MNGTRTSMRMKARLNAKKTEVTRFFLIKRLMRIEPGSMARMAASPGREL